MLSEVLSLAKLGKIRTRARSIGFSEMNKTFEELAAGKIEGGHLGPRQGLASSFLRSESLQRAGPCHNLIQHGVD